MMKMFFECLVVGFGGFVGSVLRYLVGFIPINESSVFPTNTFFINIIGAVLISFIAFYITHSTIDQINPCTLKNLILLALLQSYFFYLKVLLLIN